MFLNGSCTLDHRNGVAFFEQAPTPVVTRIVDWVGRTAAQDDLAEEWLARAQEFFEWREQRVERDGLDRAELRKLGWFVTAGAFPVEWWAPRLPKALSVDAESSPNLFVPLDDMMAQVATVSADHPAMAVVSQKSIGIA